MIGSCAGLYLMMGAVGDPGRRGADAAVRVVYDIPGGVQRAGVMAFGLMVVYVSAGFIGLLPEGILFAHHDFVLRNLVRVGGVLLRLSLTIGLLRLGASLVLLALVQIACLVFDMCATWLIIRRRYPGVRISFRDFDIGDGAADFLLQPVRGAADRRRASELRDRRAGHRRDARRRARSRSTSSPTA